MKLDISTQIFTENTTMGTVSCSGMATAQDDRGAWFEPRFGTTPSGVNFFCEKMVYCVSD